VFPTFGDGGLPLNAYYRERPIRGKGYNKNVLVLTKEGIDARVEHITSFLSYIKDEEPALLPTLLGLQCQNEAYLRANAWPFTERTGTFEAANGKTYDLSKTDQRQALMDEGYRHYHKRIVAAVKNIDPEMLVAEGVFVPAAVGKDYQKHAGVWPGAAAVDNLVQVRDLALKEQVNGMLFWTYDCQEQPRLYHATDDWELFYRKMGDFGPGTGK